PIGSTDVCTKGRVISAKIVNYQIDHNLTGTATYTINPDFGGTVTVGQNLNTRNVRFLGAVGRTLVAPTPFKLSNTVTQDLPAGSETVIHDASWFGQATFDMWNQLHVSAAIRNDGSSTFGRQNLRSWFPKGSLAWEFTKAIGECSWLSYGKARVAYGEAGVEPQPYLTSQTFSSACNGGIAQGTCNTPTQNNIGDFLTQIDSVGQPVGVYLGGGYYRCGLTDPATPVAIDAAGTTGPLSTVCSGAPKGALYIDPTGFPVGPDSRIMMDPNYDWTG